MIKKFALLALLISVCSLPVEAKTRHLQCFEIGIGAGLNDSQPILQVMGSCRDNSSHKKAFNDGYGLGKLKAKGSNVDIYIKNDRKNTPIH